MRRASALRCLILAGAGALASCAGPGPGTSSPAPSARDVVYATNQGEATVSIIDRSSLREVARVDLQALGFSENAKPHHVVVEPDGSYWYVSLIGENVVLKMTPEGRIAGRAEMEVPGLLALHPTDDLLFAGRSMSAVNAPESIVAVRRSTMEVEDEVGVLFARPHGITVRPQGDVAYVASLATNQLAAVDLAGGRVEVIGLEGAEPHAVVELALSPDGSTLVATGQLSGELLVFELTDPLRPRRTGTVDVGAWPWDVAFAPDGGTVWLANKRDDSVMAVDTRSWTVRHEVRGEGIAQPDGVVLSPDGRRVFVTNNNLDDPHAHMGGAEHRHSRGTLVVIDAGTGERVGVVPLGANPTGIGTRAGR